MKIIFDIDTDGQGNTIAVHSIDTSDPAVTAMLTALKSNVAAQITAGYGSNTKLGAYPAKTRWQAILGEVVRLNDTASRTILGV